MSIGVAPKLEQRLPDAFYNARLLDYEHLQVFLGVSRGTIKNLMKSKPDPLPSIQLGGARKFQLDKIIWWLENRQQE